MWELLRKKDVLDVDGFWTEYALYTDGERFVCVFGDTDIYTPENSDWDFETDWPSEADEWFDSYETDWYTDDEEDIYDTDPDTVLGWIQQDTIDMYRRER